MSFGRWKLSKAIALAVLLAVPVHSEESIKDFAYSKATFCARIAALSVAGQLTETAETIASYGMARCEKEMRAAAMSARKIVAAHGIKMAGWQQDELFNEAFLKALTNFVIQARQMADVKGPLAYKALGILMQEKLNSISR